MKLCLISCNIRFDNAHDGANAWPFRRANLSSLLLSHTPHLIGTQEGRYGQLKDFESFLKDFEIIDHHRSWIKERMYPSFFVKKNHFEIIKSGDLWLSETPEVAGSISFESTFPRLMTWAILQPKNSNLTFLVVNTHLDHVKVQTRTQQIKVFIQEIKRLKQGMPIIILGDFNDAPEGEVRHILNQEISGLQDAWKLFNATEETSHHAFNGECQNGSRIDWILVDQKIKVESCILEKKNFEGKYPTDHFPVICNISI